MREHFLADLHIHSRFSRATSKQLTVPTLAQWAACKGIGVLGTGDFTHPQWRAELREQLVTDEASGLYRCREAVNLPPELGRWPAERLTEPLFMLQAEISSIYKRHGKVRKVHNLVYMPDFDAAERLCRKLESIGNLTADGRPILGLDSRDLLEMVLETDARGVLVPAHAWTPWFSIFGSKSGFDSLEECFDDLSGEIFALETGLSSDPAMNRLWSHLDRCAFISNSDAHSPANLGREANRFGGRPSYDGIFAALRRTGQGDCTAQGTVEFFPEEGKYHLDGHRDCKVCLTPEESAACGNICPVCGKPMTIGVLNRVMALADRTAPDMQPRDAFASLIPLAEIAGECLGVGAQSKKAQALYADVIRTVGAELDVLLTAPLEEVSRCHELLGEAVARMRRGEVLRQGGYDGEYGVVRVFAPDELRRRAQGVQGMLLPASATTAQPAPLLTVGKMRAAQRTAVAAERHAAFVPSAGTAPAEACAAHSVSSAPCALQPSAVPSATCTPAAVGWGSYTEEQQTALRHWGSACVVLAGPGTGKTHTLMGRVGYLCARGVPAADIVVLTFTRRAAQELRARLERHSEARGVRCDTLHALGLDALHRQAARNGASSPTLLSDDGARALFSLANAAYSKPQWRNAWERWQKLRELRQPPTADIAPLAEAYTAVKQQANCWDYTDILENYIRLLQQEHSGGAGAGARGGVLHVLVDEIQDLSPLQWRCVALLAGDAGRGFFGIGDANQAIYGFRGAQERAADFARAQWPDAQVYALTQSWRSAREILECAQELLPPEAVHVQSAVPSLRGRVYLCSAPNANAEAQWIARHTAALLGGTSHREHDQHHSETVLAPSEVAILVRTKAQMPVIGKALERAGVPYALPEIEGFWRDAAVRCVLEAAALRQADAAEASPVSSAVPLPDADAMHAVRARLRAVPEGEWQRGPEAVRPLVEAAMGVGACAGGAWRGFVRQWQESGSWGALLRYVAFMQDAECVRAKAERVQVMTLHASKGLEFRAVCIAGLEDGLLPYDARKWGTPTPLAGKTAAVVADGSALADVAGAESRSVGSAVQSRASQFPQTDDADASGVAASEAGAVCTDIAPLRATDREEEQRLLYVGITRAAESVYLSNARQRLWHGQSVRLAASPFLARVARHCIRSRIEAVHSVRTKQLRLWQG